ncbi:uncharacterized protein ASCRUDRAFT_7978 [Ascoidea rubescens DSM 1968]|uniref:Uncharacterized protein n=1 Tax=Ascoidea rubescens DSM 1968 TaxID=1344418 RepID=A0A1D2VHA5_9ASCO|nr:hypothetical protein ASCRUDRAFT_7978 [Ascoidea rubescens DSM 1968]ODV61005.1 hypothetical protein ASCRUDRAFT_7978 [Ascoidea rubescens DSM 1968]
MFNTNGFQRRTFSGANQESPLDSSPYSFDNKSNMNRQILINVIKMRLLNAGKDDSETNQDDIVLPADYGLSIISMSAAKQITACILFKNNTLNLKGALRGKRAASGLQEGLVALTAAQIITSTGHGRLGHAGDAAENKIANFGGNSVAAGSTLRSLNESASKVLKTCSHSNRIRHDWLDLRESQEKSFAKQSRGKVKRKTKAMLIEANVVDYLENEAVKCRDNWLNLNCTPHDGHFLSLHESLYKARSTTVMFKIHICSQENEGPNVDDNKTASKNEVASTDDHEEVADGSTDEYSVNNRHGVAKRDRQEQPIEFQYLVNENTNSRNDVEDRFHINALPINSVFMLDDFSFENDPVVVVRSFQRV